MSLQIRRGPTVDRTTITPVEGELIYDTTLKALYVGDGTTVGGIPTAPSSVENIADVVGSLFTNGIHTNIGYTYDSLNDRINSAIDLTDYTGIITSDGFKGSVYAYDDTLLVDGILKSFDLVGTVRTDIIPASDDSFDLGSGSNRFRDLYLSGNSLYLGDAIINSVGPSVSLPAGSTVGGEPISTGNGGIIEGETYNINISGNDSSIIIDASTSFINAAGGIIGSLFTADANTVMLDAFSGSIEAPGGIFGNLNGSVSGNLSGSVFGDLTGSVFGNLSGSVFGDDSTLLIDGVNSQIVGDINARLGGDLDTNDFRITSPGAIPLVASTYVQVGDPTVNSNGSIVIRRSSFNNGILNGLGGFLFEQHHNNPSSDRMVFYRSRGTAAAPLPLQSGDRLAEITFTGNTNVAPFSQIAASIRVIADSAPIGNVVPSRIEFRCLSDPNDATPRVAVLTPSKKLLVDFIEGLEGVLSVTGNLTGDVTGSVFLDDSTKVIDGITGSVTASSFVQFGSLTTIERNALVAVNGMVIYNTTNNRFEGYQAGTWINLDDGTPAGA